jgi:hypothetical protein
MTQGIEPPYEDTCSSKRTLKQIRKQIKFKGPTLVYEGETWTTKNEEVSDNKGG